MKLIIDTSVIIDHLRQAQKTHTLFSSLVATQSILTISIVTIGELYSGSSIVRREQQLLDVLSYTNVATLDFATAKLAGEIRRSTPIAMPDAFIAATALSLNLPLVTLNTRDFAKIKGLTLYKS